jgi:hypothetical protein
MKHGKWTVDETGKIYPCNQDGQPLPYIIRTWTEQAVEHCRKDPAYIELKFWIFIGKVEEPHCTVERSRLIDSEGNRVPGVRVVHTVELNGTPRAICNMTAVLVIPGQHQSDTQNRSS